VSLRRFSEICRPPRKLSINSAVMTRGILLSLHEISKAPLTSAMVFPQLYILLALRWLHVIGVPACA